MRIESMLADSQFSMQMTDGLISMLGNVIAKNWQYNNLHSPHPLYAATIFLKGSSQNLLCSWRAVRVHSIWTLTGVHWRTQHYLSVLHLESPIMIE